MKEESVAPTKTISAASFKDSVDDAEDYSTLSPFNFKMVVRSKEQVLFKHPSGHSSALTYAFPRDSSRKRDFRDIQVGDSLSFSWKVQDETPLPASTEPSRRGKSAIENGLISSRVKKKKHPPPQVQPKFSTTSPSLFTK